MVEEKKTEGIIFSASAEKLVRSVGQLVIDYLINNSIKIAMEKDSKSVTDEHVALALGSVKDLINDLLSKETEHKS